MPRDENPNGADPVNMQAPMPPHDRILEHVQRLAELTDEALAKSAAAGRLFGAGVSASFGDTLGAIYRGLDITRTHAQNARRDHFQVAAQRDEEREARAGEARIAETMYARLEHAYDLISERLLADGGSDPVAALLAALGTIAGTGAGGEPAAGLRAVARNALDQWKARPDHAAHLDDLPVADDPDLTTGGAGETAVALEPIRRGDVVELVAVAFDDLYVRLRRHVDPEAARTDPA